MSPEGGTNAFEPGAVLGDRYRLERRIASGGMATVWLARDTELDRDVAVKVLSDVLAQDPAYVQRFRREARVAARLSNPNLVRLFDYSGESERPYIVMEYVGGGTLADRIGAREASEVSPERLAGQLLGALAAIHEAGVVHRDVKPSNVLLDDRGDPRLTDFGIAQPEDATQLTETGHVVGTLKYMAPEVLAGNPATERSDLYALGVVLRECLAGRESPKLEALIDRLTARDPRDRPASASQALALMDTYEERATTATVPIGAAPGPGARVVELSAKRVLAVLLALAIIGGIVAIATAGGGESQRGEGAGGAEPAPEAGRSAPSETTTQTPTEATTTTTTATETAAPAEATEEKPEKTEKPPKPEKAPKAEKPPKEEKAPPGHAKGEEDDD